MIIPADKVTTAEVKDWKGLHLLHFQGSTCSQKVRLMLGELEQEWVSHPVNLVKHQNSTPWFLGINPRGVVPVLVHDGVVHVESNDIISYLDRTFGKPGNSYFFNDSDTLAKEAQGLLDLEDSLHLELRLLTIQFGPIPLRDKKTIDEQENNGAFDAKRAHEVTWWRDKAENGIREEDARDACRAFANAFEQLDQRLANHPWLMGERISIVDISWFVNMQRLVNLGYPLKRHPHLQDCYQRLCSRPAFRTELRHPGSRFEKLIIAIVKNVKRLRGTRIENFL